jgi:hypothetical protein
MPTRRRVDPVAFDGADRVDPRAEAASTTATAPATTASATTSTTTAVMLVMLVAGISTPVASFCLYQQTTDFCTG